MVKATKGNPPSPLSTSGFKLTSPSPSKGVLITWSLPPSLPPPSPPLTRHPLSASHSDPAVKQILLQLDETEAIGRRFIIQDLDDSHLLVSGDAVERVKELLEFELEKNNYVGLEA